VYRGWAPFAGNCSTVLDDYFGMQCAQYREALSARLDGEPLGMPAGELDQHLTGCPACTSWSAAAIRVTRLVRLAPAPDVPDLSAQILSAQLLPAGSTPVGSGPARRRGWLPPAVRIALAVVATIQAAIGWPALALGMDTMHAPEHVAHESGAWNVALAVALLAVARRPRYAAGLLPLLAAFVVVLTVVSLPDVIAGYVPSGRIAAHLLLVGALALVAALARQLPRPEMPPVGGRGAAPGWAGGDPDTELDGVPVEAHRRAALGVSRHRASLGDDMPGRALDGPAGAPTRRVVA
jgi:predicted anti-sigma-YlaC factor YlaD